jgi:hypothetical protein
MRFLPVLTLVLLTTACSPGGERRPPRPTATTAAEPDKQTLQCLADLSRNGVGFKALPDRYFDNGCSALGAVQLLEIGTPVSNLGAMTCPLARAFAAWVREAVQPAALSSLGSRVVRIESFGTYSWSTAKPGLG